MILLQLTDNTAQRVRSVSANASMQSIYSTCVSVLVVRMLFHATGGVSANASMQSIYSTCVLVSIIHYYYSVSTPHQLTDNTAQRVRSVSANASMQSIYSTCVSLCVSSTDALPILGAQYVYYSVSLYAVEYTYHHATGGVSANASMQSIYSTCLLVSIIHYSLLVTLHDVVSIPVSICSTGCLRRVVMLLVVLCM